MSDEKQIRELFSAASVPLERDDIWSVQSARVVKHKALERLAAALKIKFDPPQILRAERDEAVILVSGSLGEATEWSIGEAAVNVNYRISGKMAAYVYAMAEKRGKDRVILKLAGLHGVYSEDEADDFKQSQRGTFDDTADAYLLRVRADIQCFETPGELREWWDKSTSDRERAGVVKGTDAYAELWSMFIETGKKLASKTQAAA